MVQINTNISPRLCVLQKCPTYDGYGVHLSRNLHAHGLRIHKVESNSPGEKAGLVQGDIVLAINGRSIKNEDFYHILSYIQNEIKQNELSLLVLDSTIINSNERNKIEPHVCSVILESCIDSIGITLETDTDFTHIITHIEPNSPGARAGLEQNDCILSINNMILFQSSLEDVLNFIKQNSTKLKFDFLVAKKCYLLNIVHENQFNETYIIHVKYCRLKFEKKPEYFLSHKYNLHFIKNIHLNSHEYKSGLRNNDIIILINKLNIEQMTTANVKVLLENSLEKNDFLLIKKTNINKYKYFKTNSFINWNLIHSEIEHYIDQSFEVRIIFVPYSIEKFDFKLSRFDSTHFMICEFEKCSSTEQIGLQINDILISINGQSLINLNYETILQLIQQSFQQDIVQFVVLSQTNSSR